MASYNDITTKFSKLKGWPSQTYINQSLLRKSALEAVYAGHFSSGDNTRARWRVPDGNHAIKQNVTVHEKSRKAEPFNGNQKVVQVVNFDQIDN